jgi:DNA (cytosine-5)-methyltransferase 1
MLTHASLFSGIGGFDLAAEWAGWENIFHCEWNPFGQKVLAHHFPNSKSYNDITKTNFSIHAGTVDVLTGGFPCQPYSQAGKRLGKEDERHLWPEMLRAIREIKPSWVVGENVLGIVNWNGGMVFEEVQLELEAEGYEVQTYILPAASVNAPHQRYRTWFVAYSNSYGNRNNKRPNTKENGISKVDRSELCTWEFIRTNSNDVAYSENIGQSETKTFSEWQKHKPNDRDFIWSTFSAISRSENASDSDNKGCERNREQPIAERKITSSSGFRRWDNFPTQPSLCRRDDGISKRLDGITFSKWRNESIKGYGNAIVPQVAYEIFKAINEFELLINK